jgi:NAD(P)-dependent dehydrogenase (short-subunit alcohol dehydrogenase family)
VEQVVNVSALEGKFSVGKKSTAHPHTNMAKAALNMMTLTSSRDFLKSKILVNAVDTGWVTDMAPLGQGAKTKTHATHVGPPLDEEVSGNPARSSRTSFKMHVSMTVKCAHGAGSC